jgi:hypothetical protein
MERDTTRDLTFGFWLWEAWKVFQEVMKMWSGIEGLKGGVEMSRGRSFQVKVSRQSFDDERLGKEDKRIWREYTTYEA